MTHYLHMHLAPMLHLALSDTSVSPAPSTPTMYHGVASFIRSEYVMGLHQRRLKANVTADLPGIVLDTCSSIGRRL
jgi:hypothetical protein